MSTTGSHSGHDGAAHNLRRRAFSTLSGFGVGAVVLVVAVVASAPSASALLAPAGQAPGLRALSGPFRPLNSDAGQPRLEPAEGGFATGIWGGRWTTVPFAPRFFHSATRLRDGTVLVAGGCLEVGANGCTSAPVASAQIYEPARRAWSPAGTMTVGRVGHTATLLPDGKVLVAGGCTDVPRGGPGCFPANEVSSAELYDPASRRWSPARPMALPHLTHTATLLSATPTARCGPNCGKVLVLGAGFENGRFREDDAELYDPGSGTWAPTAATAVPRAGHTATLLADGRVLVVGAPMVKPDAPPELYDPKDATWKPTGSAERAPRFQSHTATLLADGTVLVAGGAPFAPLPDPGSTELYDPTASPDPRHPEVSGGAFRLTDPLPVTRSSPAAVRLGGGQVLLAGGILLDTSAGGFRPTPSTVVYDPRTRRWRPGPAMAAARGATGVSALQPFSATLLRDGGVLVVGGGFPVASEGGSALPTPVNGAELYSPARRASDRPMSFPKLLAVGALFALLVAAGAAAVRLRRRRGPA